MDMKKLIIYFITILMISMVFASCNKKEDLDSTEKLQDQTSQSTKKLQIVSTIFPQYDWIREILGDNIENADLTLLLNSGIDLHNYQPTTDDIVKISNCDMFIYVGGESDAWVEDALKTATNKDMVVINFLDVLGNSVKEEEIKEGMEHAHDHEEVDINDIQDRPLADWQGDWVTIENALNNGALDSYITHEAEEAETDFDSQKSSYVERWKSNYETLKITDSSVAFGDKSGNYKYIGYKSVESDDSVAVWYGFECETAEDGMPKYIAFSDHGTGDQEEHEEHIPHFHLRYGDESFDALVLVESWAPTYFPSSAGDEEIAEVISGHSHSHEGELDEHVWLSLKNAKTLCSHIADKLSEVDPENSSVYKNNVDEYNKKLDELDGKYKEMVTNAAYKTLLFGDRFPFRYLVDDYGLDYYAAFSGCSAETEASFETIVFLANKINELKLKNVMVIETSDQSIAKTIIENSNNKDQKILTLDSVQSVTTSDISDGITYLSIMEKNLDVLKEALN